MLDPLNLWLAVRSDTAESLAEVTTWVQLVLSAWELGTTAMHRLQISYANTIPLQIQQGKPGYIPCSCDCGGPGLENTCHQKGCDQESPHFHTNNITEREVFVMSPRRLLLCSLFSYSFFFSCLSPSSAGSLKARAHQMILFTTAQAISYLNLLLICFN